MKSVFAMARSTQNAVRAYARAVYVFGDDRKDVLFLTSALVVSLYLLVRMNPFNIPAFDDSAIVMRYLLNFQKGYFFTYNIADGPVYGVSSILFGLVAGCLARFGADPQPAIIMTSFIGSVLFFYFIFRIFALAVEGVIVPIVFGLLLLLSSVYVSGTFFIGLEASINLSVVAALFYVFLARYSRAFHVVCFLAILSKLDTASIVSGLIALNFVRAWMEKGLRREIWNFVIFFLVPCLAWFAIATVVFKNPLPQSFLSKFLFRAKAPPTSWFPFIEPFLVDWRLRVSFLIGIGAAVVAIGMAIRAKTLQGFSFAFSISLLGTLLIYYVYNPGEKMPWYYTLPEFLLLMSVFTLPFSARLLSPGLVRASFLVVSLLTCIFVLVLRAEATFDRIDQARYWQIVHEGERDAAARLANEVAPKANPVLWNGHGYPAYRFNGYVVDYAGLNSRLIWKSLDEIKKNDPRARAFLEKVGMESAPLSTRVEYYLIDLAHANTFFLHGLFDRKMQEALNLRLAGTFYAINLVGAPAYRIFVIDEGHHDVVVPIPITSLSVTGRIEQREFFVAGKSVTLDLPAGASRLFFGARKAFVEQRVSVGTVAGEELGACRVPALVDRRYPEGVEPCEIAVPAAAAPSRVIVRTDMDSPLGFFEPAVRIPATSPEIEAARDTRS
jgi:hypothetical protein